MILRRDYSPAKQYLAKVLPWPQADDPPAWIGISYKSIGEKDQPIWVTRAVASVTEAINLINWASGLKNMRDIYVCMGSLSVVTERVSKRGFKYITAERAQENVVGLKSLYIDLDAKGEDDDSYDTIEEAVVALFKFLKAIKFPAPSLMVKSGGGVHVYWTLDRILTPEEWLPLAHALVNAAQQHELRFDRGCSIDYARILRVPCTLNHKFNPPRDVELVADVLDFDYSVARIRQALAPYKVAVRAASASSFIENPNAFNVKLPALSDDDLSAGIEKYEFPKPSLKVLAKVCPFVKDAVVTGGASHKEPLWHMAMMLALWTEEGEASAHVMSMGHADYSSEATTEKYETAVAAQAEKELGWPQCSTIANQGSKLCVGCPHLAAGKSPLNFVTLIVNQINGVPVPNLITGNIRLPPDYAQDPAGYITQAITNKDGSTMHQRVCDYIFLDGWIDRGSPQVLNFITSTEVGVTSVIQIGTDAVGGQDMRGTLQSAGLMMRHLQVKPMGEFLVAWVQKLQQLKNSVRDNEPFGWALVGPRVEGFAYGGTLYTPTGQRSAPINDHAMAAAYAPAGQLPPWTEAVKLVHSQNRQALDAVLAASFAAPLVRSTGQSGLLMSLYSLESGIGKTTVMKTAQAVWGDPVRAMQGLDDTSASVLNKMGKLKALPMFWDELKTEEDARRMVVNLFTVTRGRERGRLRSTIEQREPGSWETLLVSASNESLVDFVVSRTKMTTAGIYRMFEFTVPPGSDGRIAISDASRIISSLTTNFGGAGQIYSQFLGNNFQRIDDEVAAEMVAVGDEVGLQPDERYWGALVAIILVGAGYANELELTGFNLNSLRKFMIDQFHGMRQLREETSVDMKQEINVANILVQFLRDMRARRMLITDVMWTGRGKPKPGHVTVQSDVSKLEALIVHAALKDKRVRISLSGLNDWLEQNEYPRHVFIESLKVVFGAVRINATLGAGTPYASGNEFVLDLDMTNSAAKLFLQDLTP